MLTFSLLFGLITKEDFDALGKVGNRYETREGLIMVLQVLLCHTKMEKTTLKSIRFKVLKDPITKRSEWFQLRFSPKKSSKSQF